MLLVIGIGGGVRAAGSSESTITRCTLGPPPRWPPGSGRETNQDEGYGAVSNAPPPGERYRQFHALDYPRKVATVEPVVDFDEDVFRGWLVALKPEYVWLGFNSRPKHVVLPEPSPEKMHRLAEGIRAAGIEARVKDARGAVI